MSDKRTLKAAMVGLSLSHAGTVGPEQPSFMRQFHHLDGVEVTAFCEWRNTDFLKDAEKHFPAAARYDNLDDLLEKEDFDLACVCVSPSQVPETLRKLSEAGKHYFVDKPLSLSADELVPAVRAVNDNSLTTFLGYPYRFHPPAMDLRDLIDQGVLGRPLDIESRQFSVQVGGEFGKPAVSVRYTKDGHEVLSAARTPSEGGGILHFIGCHHLELLRYVMGSEVKSVQAMMGRPQGYMEEPLEDIAILAMEFENGAYGCLHHGYTKPVGPRPAGVRQRVRVPRHGGLGRVDAGRQQPARGIQRLRQVGGRAREGLPLRVGRDAAGGEAQQSLVRRPHRADQPRDREYALPQVVPALHRRHPGRRARPAQHERRAGRDAHHRRRLRVGQDRPQGRRHPGLLAGEPPPSNSLPRGEGGQERRLGREGQGPISA